MDVRGGQTRSPSMRTMKAGQYLDAHARMPYVAQRHEFHAVVLTHSRTFIARAHGQKNLNEFFFEDMLETSKNLVIGDEAIQQGREIARLRPAFSPKRWSAHRSNSRYIRHMAGVIYSTTFRSLVPPLSLLGAFALAVCVYQSALESGQLPSGYPSIVIPFEPSGLVSFALSLLLATRTNTSYERWVTANSLWTDVLARCRSCIRAVECSRIPSPEKKSIVSAAVAKWLIAFLYLVRFSVCPEDEEETMSNVAAILSADEVASLRRLPVTSRPSYSLSVVSHLGSLAKLPSTAAYRLDECVSLLETGSQAAIKLATTPIPLAYTRHTSRFMVLFLAALPLGLYGHCGSATPVFTVIISFLLLGIDCIGVQIEEPFGLLPLDRDCDDFVNELRVGAAVGDAREIARRNIL